MGKDNQFSIIELEEVLVEATRRLDIDMFKEFAPNVILFNSEKRYFISDLEITFNKLKNFGDTSLESHFGACGRCNKHCYGYLFVGNKSRNYINFLFDIDDMVIHDLTECSDFKVLQEVNNLNKRIYIHSFNDKDSDEYVPF